MAYFISPVKGNQNIKINIPTREESIKTYRVKTKDLFNDVAVKENIKLQELLKLLQDHLILQEYWKEGH